MIVSVKDEVLDSDFDDEVILTILEVDGMTLWDAMGYFRSREEIGPSKTLSIMNECREKGFVELDRVQ